MKKYFLFLLTAALTMVSFAGTIQLAKDGKALYTIVERPDAARLEKAAVKDFKWHLDKITGGDFKIGNADSKRIFIGVPAPGDDKPMALGERRLRSVNGDIYIYGEANDGAAFGIYDLLEKYCGCRWFTIWGESRIPSNPNLALPELKDNKIPPFVRFETTSLIGIGTSQRARDFLRRHRVHITANRMVSDDDYQLGAGMHTFSAYLPPGFVPYGKRIRAIMGPYKYFKDKKYFDEHPEWFSVDKSGQRVPHRQLCLSNKEVRKEFLKNLEIVIEKEYKGGDALIVVDINDRNEYMCQCEGCKAMEKEYETPGGPFFDYLFELSEIFAKKYPRIVIRSLAYGCTLTPPNRKLPSNVMMWFAPLGGLDFLKSYANTVRVKNHPLDGLKKLATRSDAHWKWMYISPYYRGSQSVLHFAGLNRLAVNMRYYNQYNVKSIMTEHGLFVNGFTNFQELRVYMLFRLKEDLTQNEDEIIREYIDSCYGKAAGMIYKHIQELEDLGAKSKSIVKYNIVRPWYVDYMTPANLLRWQKDFNRMEKLVADDPSALLHVKRARISLDQATLGRWPDLAKIRKGYSPRYFRAFRKRHFADCREIVKNLYADPNEDPQRLKKWTDGAMARFRRAIKFTSPVEKVKPKAMRPLPAMFDGIPAENIQRCPFYPAMRPHYVRDPKGKLVPDSKAAFGTMLPGKASSSMAFIVRTDFAKYLPPLLLSDIIKKPRGEYHYYHLGRDDFGPTGGWFPLGCTTPLGCAEFSGFGPGICKADFYISARYEGKRKIFFDELVVVKVPGSEQK